MKIDNALLRGHARVDYTPVHPKDVVNLEFVQQMVMQGAAGAVFITNVAPTSTGLIGGKQYAADTVPANAVITECFSDTNNIRIHFQAEGPSNFYSPVVKANDVTAQNMIEIGNDKRLFSGYVDIVLTESGTVTVASNTGSTATVNVTLLTEGPVVQSVTIGALPGVQTTVKQGDIVPYTAVVANAATDIIVKNLGAASAESAAQTFGADNSAGAGFKTVSGSFVVANRTGAQALTITAANFIGTEGAAVASSNITLDQVIPTFGAISVAYPAGQTALKGTETADVTVTVSNSTSVSYGFDNGSVAANTTYAATKTVTRSSGTYVTSNNYHIVANKASNGSSASFDGSVIIADAAASAAITIIGAPARLQSSAAGNDYTVQIAPNQVLPAAPSLDASSGTWVGSWTQSGNNWRRTLRIADADPKGAQTFSNLSMTGRAGVVSTTISSGAGYTVGGLVLRTITFPAFARFTAIGSSVVTIGKTNAKYSGTADNLALRNDTNQAAASYTITNSSGNYAATGDNLYLSDLDYANSNTSGTLRVDFLEAV